MSDEPKASPPKDEKTRREEALARALRANLRRRKASGGAGGAAPSLAPKGR